MIRLIEDKERDIAERVMTMLSNEDNDESFEYLISSDDPNVILCKANEFGLVLSLDCNNVSKSIVSYDNILSASYLDPDNFFDKVSRLDDISSKLRHVWYDFNSFIDEVKGEI